MQFSCLSVLVASDTSFLLKLLASCWLRGVTDDGEESSSCMCVCEEDGEELEYKKTCS